MLMIEECSWKRVIIALTRKDKYPSLGHSRRGFRAENHTDVGYNLQ